MSKKPYYITTAITYTSGKPVRGVNIIQLATLAAWQCHQPEGDGTASVY